MRLKNTIFSGQKSKFVGVSQKLEARAAGRLISHDNEKPTKPPSGL